MLTVSIAPDGPDVAEYWRGRLDIDRGLARAYGHETLAWLNDGAYLDDNGESIDIRALVDSSVSRTIDIPPERDLPDVVPQPTAKTHVEVANESTLSAALRLVKAGETPLVLNMANGVAPGGGWLHGSRAQEENLCRSSALWSTLRDSAMYATHSASGNYESSDWMIVSPDVPVLRADDGTPLDEPWLVSFITSAAPVAYRMDPTRSAELLERRIHRLLLVAASLGYRSLVLGAWGCGAFRNDPVRTAAVFSEALAGPFDGVFDHVVFAITDWSPERATLGPFVDAFRAAA